MKAFVSAALLLALMLLAGCTLMLVEDPGETIGAPVVTITAAPDEF